MAPTASSRPNVHPTPQTAVRSSTPKQILTVRPPATPCTQGIPAHPSPNPGTVLPQRVLLSPDMQARLPCKYPNHYCFQCNCNALIVPDL